VQEPQAFPIEAAKGLQETGKLPAVLDKPELCRQAPGRRRNLRGRHRLAGTQVIGSHPLLAIGRRPNTDYLGLDAAGVATDQHGYIRVDDQLRTNVPERIVWRLANSSALSASRSQARTIS
jgi:pyruvate/2-oxoglutarate dehydrogenase complex dihydrolipoamide dehydrogenase (E3) component